MSTFRALLLAAPLMVATACGSNPCECDECETAFELCEADDQACEDDAVALCDAADTDTDSAQ